MTTELPDAEDAGIPEGNEAESDVETRAWCINETEHGQRLDKVLVRHAPEFSRSHLQALVERGAVSVDGLPLTQPSRKLRLGQAVALQLLPTEQAQAFHPQAMDLRVLHEDAHLLVLDKPAGLVVHPAPGHWSGTLLNGLLAHHAGASALPRAGIVHRLDMDTSGVMVVAKTLTTMHALVQAIAAREVQRLYRAIAVGRVEPDLQDIEAPVGRDPRSRIRMAVLASGKPSRTTVQVVSRTNAHSALECCLHTGRTHQIRVHLAHRGHPLVADRLYGGTIELGIERQALHAYRLQFRHPATGDEIACEATPPTDFEQAWKAVHGVG